MYTVHKPFFDFVLCIRFDLAIEDGQATALCEGISARLLRKGGSSKGAWFIYVYRVLRGAFVLICVFGGPYLTLTRWVFVQKTSRNRDARYQLPSALITTNASSSTF